MNIALIVGAGWKPADEWRLNGKWRDIVPLRTPEVLWPLPDNHTVLSRYAAQMMSIGVQHIFAGISPIGKSPAFTEDAHRKKVGAEVPEYGSPIWTQEKVDYIKSLDIVPLVDQGVFDPKNCYWQTTVAMLLQIDMKWNRAVIIPGDYVLSTAFLERLASQARYPEQVWLLPKHSIEFIDRAAVPRYVEYLKSVFPTGQTSGWLRRNESGLNQRYIWDFKSDLEPTLRQAYHEKRRQSFCEVGPGEYPAGWKLAEGDPI